LQADTAEDMVMGTAEGTAADMEEAMGMDTAMEDMAMADAVIRMDTDIITVIMMTGISGL
jgi:hypothetical protein